MMEQPFASMSHSMSVEQQSTGVSRERMLRAMSLLIIGMGTVSFVVLVLLWLTGNLADITLAYISTIIVAADVVAGVTLGLIRSPYSAIAARFFLYGFVALSALAMFIAGGFTGPTTMMFVFPVVAAGLLGRAIDSLRLAAVAAIGYVLLAVLEQAGLLQPLIVINSSLNIFFVATFLMVVALLALTTWQSSKTLAEALAQVNEQSEALLLSNERLMEKNIQQVELGSELSSSAAQMQLGSQQQASGATEQASAVSEVSTTIEELGSTASQIAQSSEQVAEAAQQTLENLSTGQDAVDASIQAMERIRSRVQDVSERVLGLGERSQQIGEIIDLIDDISDETHLLALNAAIEAAGAGEHGRRFAVVAAEVKNLANRALVAAREVRGVIAEMRQATNAAVLAAEEGGKEVERGVELAHRAGQVMDTIVMVAERTAQSAAEISLATAQQQSASEQVVETMREVADVARQSASGARQMADSAAMLTAIAERLHGITRF